MRILLEVKGIYVYYGQVRALENVSLEVGEGEIVAVLGANGAGKSTLLKTISGLIHPQKGQILLDGKPIHNLEAHEVVRKCGIMHVPEGRGIFPLSTTRDNLLVGAYTRSDSEVKVDAEKFMKVFPVLHERRNELAKMLSGGEQQMLAICRALMARPKILLLDEPSLGLAPRIVKSIFEMLQELRDQGITILLVEQNALQALRIANRAYVLVNGEVTLEGKGEDLLQNDEVRRLYLGGV